MARATAQRLDATFSDPGTIQKIHRLMTLLEAGKADVFRGALDVFDWCIRQVQEGRQIASISENGTSIRELATPLLEAAREQQHMRLNAEAFDTMAYLVVNPPEPTSELRELMAEARARHTSAPTAVDTSALAAAAR
jgi:hypothetical protein